ncbi:hypothetical protein GBAR_LOCUS6550, partial [Geodia barretti]
MSELKNRRQNCVIILSYANSYCAILPLILLASFAAFRSLPPKKPA